MKLLDIMKKYDRCLVRESARLTKIYNMLIKESENEDLGEATCPECGNDPCTCDEAEQTTKAKKTDECGEVEIELIPEEDFIKTEKECDEKECDENDDEEPPISEAEFFEAASKADDAECNEDEEEHTEDAEETKPQPKSQSKSKADDDDEMMSAAEFFAEAAKDEVDETEETEEAEETEVNEEVEIDPGEAMVDAKELLPETEEKKLEESLKSYRRKNHRLFNG